MQQADFISKQQSLPGNCSWYDGVFQVRREQLRRTSEKLSEDLAQYVARRDNAVEKTRATAAVEAARGTSTKTSQSQYHHKLRLARVDVARVTKVRFDIFCT